MVLHSSQTFVQFDKSGEKLASSVDTVAPAIDLAVLKLDDESAFDGHPALPVSSKLLSVQQAVFANGYPQGGSMRYRDPSQSMSFRSEDILLRICWTDE